MKIDNGDGTFTDVADPKEQWVNILFINQELQSWDMKDSETLETIMLLHARAGAGTDSRPGQTFLSSTEPWSGGSNLVFDCICLTEPALEMQYCLSRNSFTVLKIGTIAMVPSIYIAPWFKVDSLVDLVTDIYQSFRRRFSKISQSRKEKAPPRVLLRHYTKHSCLPMVCTV